MLRLDSLPWFRLNWRDVMTVRATRGKLVLRLRGMHERSKKGVSQTQLMCRICASAGFGKGFIRFGLPCGFIPET